MHIRRLMKMHNFAGCQPQLISQWITALRSGSDWRTGAKASARSTMLAMPTRCLFACVHKSHRCWECEACRALRTFDATFNCSAMQYGCSQHEHSFCRVNLACEIAVEPYSSDLISGKFEDEFAGLLLLATGSDDRSVAPAGGAVHAVAVGRSRGGHRAQMRPPGRAC